LLSGFEVLLEALASIFADKSAHFAAYDQRADSQFAGLPPMKRHTKEVNWIPLPDPLPEEEVNTKSPGPPTNARNWQSGARPN
jgi:hypothetical protein